MARRHRAPQPATLVATDTRGRWVIAEPIARGPRVSRGWNAALIGVFGLLLMLGLGKLATDTAAVAARDQAAGYASMIDRCAEAGLIAIGDTGLCTHGPDSPPLGNRTGVQTAPITAAGGIPPIDCVGDGVSGNRVQVLYARASDSPSRLAEYRATFQSIAAEVSQMYRDSAAKTGGARSLRLVHSSGCEVTVTEVVVTPQGISDSYYLFEELAAQGYDDTNRKYMIFGEGGTQCGIGTLWPDERRDPANLNNFGPSYGLSVPYSQCWSAHVAGHELMHNLGGVQRLAPNATRNSHCVDDYDVMCYDDGYDVTMRYDCPDEAVSERLFDCNNDDYFHTSPSSTSYLGDNWNTAQSQFLIGAVPQPAYPKPANDELNGAVRMAARPFTATLPIYMATESADDPYPGCTPYAVKKTIWYKITPASSGTVTIDTTGTTYQHVVAVYQGARGSLEQVGCGSTGPSLSPLAVSFAATANTTYHVMVAAYYNNLFGRATLTVNGPAEAPERPELTLSKVSSKYNGSVTAWVTGLSPNIPVTLRWPRQYEISGGPNAGERTDVLATGTTSATGAATLTFRTPLEPLGNYLITGRDGGGRQATATLRVIPRVMLNETRGPTTTRLRVYFYGFAPSDSIAVWWYADVPSPPSFAVLKTITVASNGRASAIVVIPRTAPTGTYKIVGSVQGASRSASTRFVVTAPAIAPPPTGTPSPTPTPTSSATPTETPTPTGEATATVTGSPEPVATETPTPEPVPTETSTPVPPPTETPLPNASPVAVADEDQTLVDTDGGGDEVVSLDGGASSDPEGTTITYTWSVGGGEVATGVTAAVTLPVGETTVTLTVTDALGASATDEVIVRVAPVEASSTPGDGG